jgi:methyl-accepting chemotaxis protein
MGHKLMLAMGGLIGLMTLIVLLAVTLITRLAAETQVNQEGVAFTSATSAAALSAKAIANDERGFLISGDQSYRDEAFARIPQVRSALQAAQHRATNDHQREVVRTATVGFDRWVTSLHQEFATYPTDPAAAITASLSDTRELRKDYEANLAHAQALGQTAISNGDASVSRAASRSTRVLLGCLLLVLVVGVGVTTWIIRLIALPLHRLLTYLSG